MCSILINISNIKKYLNQSDIRKGMVMLDYKDQLKVESSYGFKADIWSYDGTIQTIKQTF